MLVGLDAEREREELIGDIHFAEFWTQDERWCAEVDVVVEFGGLQARKVACLRLSRSAYDAHRADRNQGNSTLMHLT